MSLLDFDDSLEEASEEEAPPKRKRKKNESDSGSDVSVIVIVIEFQCDEFASNLVHFAVQSFWIRL